MREEEWQGLVSPSLCETLGIRPECLHAEVQTQDGSIADFVATLRQRLVIVELKMADPGEALHALRARDLRQLRHYRDAADEVYLVTLAAPRTYEMVDGRVLVQEPFEAQLLPAGVGWMVFDTVARQLVMLRPASPLVPKPAARNHLVERIVVRLQRAVRTAQHCRGTA